MEIKDYYELLEIREDASDREIRDAYRRRAFQYHPDRNEGKPEAAEMMKKVNEAYAVLSHAEKKREYDFLRRQYGPDAASRFRRSHTSEEIFQDSDIQRIFEEVARSFGLRGFEEVFRDQYGNGFRTFEFRRPGASGRGFVFTGPFARGGRDGGEAPGAEALGKLPRFLLEKLGGLVLPREGRDTEGSLFLTEEESLQGGAFPYEEKLSGKKLMVKIPPGIGEGRRIRLAGMGRPGKNGGRPGDLYLRVRVRKPLLGRIGDFLSRFVK